MTDPIADIEAAIAAKSDQMNADDLVAGPLTGRILRVKTSRVQRKGDQPVSVFLDCWKAAHIDNRGMGWQKAATDDPNGTLRTRLRSMPHENDLWRKRYPTLPGILEDEPNIPKRNVYARNISAGGIWDDIHPGTRESQTVEDNLAFDDDEEWISLIKNEQGRPVRLEPKDPAAVTAIGFEPLPLAKIGVYRDERRASHRSIASCPWPFQRSTHRSPQTICGTPQARPAARP